MHGELKIINPPYTPHPSLVQDFEAQAKLPESRAGTVLWALRKEEPVPAVSMESVLPKAHFHAVHRDCPIHGVAQVISRIWRPRDVYSVETLACGHMLLVSRVAGSKKDRNSQGRSPKDFHHRGWHFNFKQIYDRHGK